MCARESGDLSGKTALITGASKGLGKAMALALSQAARQSRSYPAIRPSSKPFNTKSRSWVGTPRALAPMLVMRTASAGCGPKSSITSTPYRFSSTTPE